MFCKNCGKELTEDSVACGDCGFKKGDGEGYCSHCGQPVAKGQYMCVKCGFLLSEETPSSNKNFRKKALSNPFVKATVYLYSRLHIVHMT